MEKIRILFISHTFPPIAGGVETHNYELSTWIAKQANIRLIVNRRRWLIPFFLIYAAARAAFLAKNYDVIVLGSCLLSNVGWFVKKFTEKPVVAVAHGLDLTFRNLFYQKLWIGIFLKKIDKIIAVGNETVKIAKEKRIPEDKIVFIPNGVDTEKHLVSATRSDLEKIIGQSAENKKILLTSGRLAKRKGAAWFISNVMPKLGEEFLYVIAGDGPDKKNIEEAVKNNGLENRVVLLGYVSDEKRNVLLNTADLFVQPNIKIPGDMEGFGISVIEAGACRLPVLASGIEGLKDAIKDGQNGFLAESGNANMFAGKINELFAQGSPREIYCGKVREYVVQNYSWEYIAQRYLKEVAKCVELNKQ
jgi:phosphatidylinositol alpha-1,6-mannosyltransferase